MNRILIVEDDKKINELVSDYLETAGFEVDCAYDGIEGLNKFARNSYCCIVIDVMMPGLDGWALCRRIRKTADTLIIFLTARSDEDDKLMGFELGADEYVTKPFSPKVLVARINALLKRTSSLSESNAFCDGGLKVDPRSMTASVDDRQLHLTSKEYQLLIRLTGEPGRVFTRDNLLSDIWGYDYFGDGRVIDTNIKTLRKKLGRYSEKIITVIGSGYKYIPGEDEK